MVIIAEKFCRIIDSLNEWVGKIFCWLAIPMTGIVTMDVILRYVFNRPTIWAWDINVQILAAFSLLSGGYVLLHHGHIAVDVLVERTSSRQKAWIDVITFPVFLFSIAILLWKTGDAAVTAIQIKETVNLVFRSPTYFIKPTIAIGVLLLLLQGISKFLRDLSTVTSPKETK